MQCRIISKENLAEVKQMDAFVKHHEKSHFLQTPAWAQVKEAWDWRGILACEDDRVVGALSVLIRPLPIGFSLMYAPRGPVCDRNDPYAMACLLGAADDLLCMWLYHKYGYICIPSTNKLSTQLYECVLLDPKTGEHIYIQVKNGNVEINADDYEQLQGDTWFLTTKGRVINAEK